MTARLRPTRLLLALLATVLVLPVADHPRAEAASARLLFEDNFSGTSVDGSRWRSGQYWGRTTGWPGTRGDGTTNQWNNELTAYYGSQSTVAKGVLNVTAINEQRPAWRQDRTPYSAARYTSGLLETEGLFDFLYGRVEIRAKLPKGKGLHPALWLMSVGRRWPPEIDVMEYIGDQQDRVYHNVHWSSGSQWGATVIPGGDLSQSFHTFTIDWAPGRLVWYVDGVERHRVEGSGKVPSERMYLVMAVAVGGNWPGAPDGSTPFPATMAVDYVRVWDQATSSGTTTTTTTTPPATTTPPSSGAAISTLVDNFDSAPLNSSTWTDVQGPMALDGGRVSVPANGAYPHLATGRRYDLTSGQVFVEVPRVASGTSSETYFVVGSDASNQVSIIKSGSNLLFRSIVNGVLTNTAVPYSSTQHRWWRMRASGGTVVWETSADGRTWMPGRDAAVGMDLTSTFVQLRAGHWGTEVAPASALFDNVNTPPGAPV